MKMRQNPWPIRRPPCLYPRGPRFVGLEHKALAATLKLVGLWLFEKKVANIPSVFQLEGKERKSVIY